MTGIGTTTQGGGQIRNITIESAGDGYIAIPDGSLGGDGRTWKESDEGYAITDDGRYFVVPEGIQPPDGRLEAHISHQHQQHKQHQSTQFFWR